MGYLIGILVGYLFGCSNMALYISKLKKIDLRKDGSGNLGTLNAFTLIGVKAAIITGIHDLGKSMLAIWLMQWLFPDLAYLGCITGVACVIGHIFPFYLKFKGGKGHAPFWGMIIAIDWKFAAFALILMLLTVFISNYIILGNVVTVLSFPIYMWVRAGSFVPALIILIASALILYKHRTHFVRLAKGTEQTFRDGLCRKNPNCPKKE